MGWWKLLFRSVNAYSRRIKFKTYSTSGTVQWFQMENYIFLFKSKYMFQVWPSAFPQLFPGCCSKKSRNVLLKIIADGARFSFPLYPILAMQVLTSDARHKTADKDHLGSNMNNLLFLAFQYCSSIESGRQGRSILVQYTWRPSVDVNHLTRR